MTGATICEPRPKRKGEYESLCSAIPCRAHIHGPTETMSLHAQSYKLTAPPTHPTAYIVIHLSMTLAGRYPHAPSQVAGTDGLSQCKKSSIVPDYMPYGHELGDSLRMQHRASPWQRCKCALHIQHAVRCDRSARTIRFCPSSRTPGPKCCPPLDIIRVSEDN